MCGGFEAPPSPQAPFFPEFRTNEVPTEEEVVEEVFEDGEDFNLENNLIPNGSYFAFKFMDPYSTRNTNFSKV